MHECIYISINGLCIEMVKLCVCVCILVNLFSWLILYVPQPSLQGALGHKPIG
jgi:hypothetical protein